MKPSLVIIGLGNHGPSYARTRHNVGYWAVDLLSTEYGKGEWKERPKFQAIAQEALVLTVPVLLIKPLTYMNLSGASVRKVVDFYKLDPAEQLLVISDDIDLPLGEMRLRRKGGPGTHNGLKSVVEQFGENFARLRIGLGTPEKSMDLAAWVLSIPPPEERETIDAALEKIPEMIKTFILEKTED